jgi:hypothetical protein
MYWIGNRSAREHSYSPHAVVRMMAEDCRPVQVGDVMITRQR